MPHGGRSLCGCKSAGQRLVLDSYQSDPTLGDRVFDLLDITFPGIRDARANGEGFGARWEDSSTPFVVEAAGRVIAHVGLLSIPLRVMGHDVVCGGIHGVATHPDHRHRGLFRDALERAMTFASTRFETLLLTTLHREYFEPFGFRVVPESIFRHRPGVGPTSVPSRALDLQRFDDRELMHRLLAERAPVSDVLGVGPEKASWAFYEYRSAIRYIESVDAAVSADLTNGTLRLYDVVGASIPSIDAIAAAFDAPVTEVVSYLTPDRLGGVFAAEPHDLRGGGRRARAGHAGFCVHGARTIRGRGSQADAAAAGALLTMRLKTPVARRRQRA